MKKGFPAVDLQIADSMTIEDFDGLQGTSNRDILSVLVRQFV
jgi:hypothetical protein